MKILSNSVFQRILMAAVIIILILMWKNSVDDAKLREATLKQNLQAIADSSKFYKTKSGKLIAERKLYLGYNDDLEKYNKDLTNRIDELKSEEPKTKVITVVDNTINVSGFSGDSTNTENQYNNGNGKLSWSFKRKGEDWFKHLSGYTQYTIDKFDNKLNIIAGNTIIVKDSLRFKVYSYVVENEDGSFSARTESSYPGMILETSGALFPENINNVPMVETNDNNISLGIQGGIGLNPIELYNGGDSPIVFYLGIGLNYELAKIIEW